MPPAPDRTVFLDNSGTPINVPPNPPLEEPARGVFTGPVDRDRLYPSRDLSGPKITRILEHADRGDTVELIELLQEVLEKDLKIANVIATRKGAVMGLQRYVIPAKLEDDASEADKKKAEDVARFCQRALDRTNFDECLSNQTNFVFFPFAFDWIVWGEDELRKTVPLYFLTIPMRHVRWDTKVDRVRLVDVNDPRILALVEPGELLEPAMTVRSISSSRPDHPLRQGLGRTMVWFYWFKIEALKSWNAFANRYGMPVRALFLPIDQLMNPDIVAKMQMFLHQLGQNASGIFSLGSELKMIEAAATRGTSVYKELIDHVNRELAGRALGHELSSESSPGQGQLGITAAMSVKQDVLEEDCNALAATVRRDLLTHLTLWNYGFDQQRFVPHYWFDYEPDRDLRAEAEVLQIVAKTFPELEFSEQQVRDIWGYEAPIDEEDGLTAGAPDQNPPPDLPIDAARRGPRPRPSRAALDRLQRRGVDRSLGAVADWRATIRAEVRAAVAGEEEPDHLVRRLTRLYPRLDAARLEESLYRSNLLSRLFGRASARR